MDPTCFAHQMWCAGRALEVEQGNSCGEGCACGKRFQLLFAQGAATADEWRRVLEAASS